MFFACVGFCLLPLEGPFVDVSLLETLKSLFSPQMCSTCLRYGPFYGKILETCLHTKCIELVFMPSLIDNLSPHPRLVWNMYAS